MSAICVSVFPIPDRTRDQLSGDLIHDDLVISAALFPILEDCEWGIGESGIVLADDPLANLGYASSAKLISKTIEYGYTKLTPVG